MLDWLDYKMLQLYIVALKIKYRKKLTHLSLTRVGKTVELFLAIPNKSIGATGSAADVAAALITVERIHL